MPNSPFSEGRDVSDSDVVVLVCSLFELLSEIRHGIDDLFLALLNVHRLSWRCRQGGRWGCSESLRRCRRCVAASIADGAFGIALGDAAVAFGDDAVPFGDASSEMVMQRERWLSFLRNVRNF